MLRERAHFCNFCFFGGIHKRCKPLILFAFLRFGRFAGGASQYPFTRLISQDSQDGVCRIDLGAEIKMGIDIGSGGDIVVSKPHLNILERYAVCV